MNMQTELQIRQEAKKLSVLKGTALSDTGSKTVRNRKLARACSQHVNGCPMCTLFIENKCIGCPLDVARQNCIQRGSLFDQWSRAGRWERKVLAKKMLSVIKSWIV